MALNSSRTAFTTSTRSLRQCRCSSAQPLTRLSSTPLRPFSSAPTLRSDARDAEPENGDRPRWSYTPEGMKGPGFSINVVKDPRRKIWTVNEDPKKLDTMYNVLLGRDGERMLPDEIKWLAVTHKSFDQGRRGFNTKLAYFGRQIIALEATRSILTTNIIGEKPTPDPYDRVPFEHPALANVDKLGSRQPLDLIRKEKMARLAVDVGLPEVVRWKPRLPENLEGSGLTVVLNTTLFAIVGAISLQHGAEVAGRVAREKILKRLIPA
ncbi:ribonuclease-III-like-domain-containing protein [Phialemonium atrogriseum]|uniref:Ribonuclease-III-like-domain-containing protein n=1 Tax=Phialemonium atrogriseum TaxID=1093897 RepID=A0AAJ0FHI9_9PEZI|nr:ribonuclease-III-like-domain-containing protein [Phialemonium atrogriseum]KAK1762224.1 ribonuclease-III-like-domain-containing protein [Phialemonium atrogriseum]